ncbi:MAG: ATP-binding cassette domain-containing protein, partial [Micromonosporaceae bacterium]|nr:ATP-binding cassette domain-containing protein [Micromonosporaceae bacterium]
PQGSVFGIIGPNGAGKTTTFNLIAGDSQPDRGDITMFGTRVTTHSAAQRAQQGLARTFQLPEPLGDLSVRENVLVGALLRRRLRSARRVADELLVRFGLAGLADAPASRLNTADGKRLELARAVATDPRLLLLDEPVAGLTEPELEEAIGLLREISAAGTTVLIIEHVLAAVFSLCATVLVLNFGAAVTIGTAAQVRRDPKVIEVYLGDHDD